MCLVDHVTDAAMCGDAITVLWRGGVCQDILRWRPRAPVAAKTWCLSCCDQRKSNSELSMLVRALDIRVSTRQSSILIEARIVFPSFMPCYCSLICFAGAVESHSLSNPTHLQIMMLQVHPSIHDTAPGLLITSRSYPTSCSASCSASCCTTTAVPSIWGRFGITASGDLHREWPFQARKCAR